MTVEVQKFLFVEFLLWIRRISRRVRRPTVRKRWNSLLPVGETSRLATHPNPEHGPWKVRGSWTEVKSSNKLTAMKMFPWSVQELWGSFIPYSIPLTQKFLSNIKKGCNSTHVTEPCGESPTIAKISFACILSQKFQFNNELDFLPQGYQAAQTHRNKVLYAMNVDSLVSSIMTVSKTVA